MVGEIVETLTARGRRMLAVSVLAFVVYALAGVAMVLVAFAALRAVMDGVADLPVYWITLACCLLVKGIANIVADKEKHRAGFDLVFEIRSTIVLRLKAFSLGFYTGERLGEISEIIRKDVDNMEMVVGHLWTRMLADIIVSATLFVGLAIIDWRMAFFMVSALPFALLFLWLGLKRAQALERENGDRAADMASLFVEYVKGIPLLKAFSESTMFSHKLAGAVSAFGESSRRSSKNKALVLAAYGFMVDAAFWIMVVAGGLLVAVGSLDLFAYLIFVVVSREFYKPFVAMQSHWMNYLKVRDSFARIQKITTAPVVAEPVNPIRPVRFSIAFNQVDFSYEEGGFKLADATFFVPDHTLTALVGESGSGKTTVTNLLLRFWDADSGSVSIGDVDVRDMSYDDLLDSISIVMQNVQLFADTIKGNIRIGRISASHEEVVEAAKKARIHDFVMTLPQGYDTVIGENGAGLSGGQRQRLSVARAFLKDAPILVLDEVTSNIDPGNEVLMQQAVSDLARNRTVLVVAHHLSTVRSADQILVLQQGSIIQRGTHDMLMADEGGYYRRLWEKSGRAVPASSEPACLGPERVADIAARYEDAVLRPVPEGGA